MKEKYPDYFAQYEALINGEYPGFYFTESLLITCFEFFLTLMIDAKDQFEVVDNASFEVVARFLKFFFFQKFVFSLIPSFIFFFFFLKIIPLL